MFLREHVFILGARFDHGRHIDIVERREQRGVLLRTLQPLGDGLTHARHLYALGIAIAGWGCSCRCRGWGGCRSRAVPLRLGGGKHVFLGQAAIFACALDRRRIDSVFQHSASHCR